MTLYNAVAVLCIVAMALIVLYPIVKLSFSDRRERLKYLKDFKKGKFAAIYTVAIPLYWIAGCFAGSTVADGLMNAVGSGIKLVVLEYDTSSASALMEANPVFNAAMYMLFVLVAVNAVVFFVTLFGEWVSNTVRTFFALRKKTVLLVVGKGAANFSIMESADVSSCGAVMLAAVNKEEEDELFVRKRAFVKFAVGASLEEFVAKRFPKFTDRRVNVIVNTGDDKLNVIYAKQIENIIVRFNLGESAARNGTGLYAYVFGEPENMSAFAHFSETTCGCVSYVNKYKLVASDLEDRFPLTRFMTEEHLDYSTATLRDDVDVNVLIFGFGKAGQQIFLTSVANDQFMVMKDGRPQAEPVHYRIYDREDSRNDKNLNHNYFRYIHECAMMAGRENEYLPLPPKPADEKFYKLAVNDNAFYDSVRADLSPKKGRKAYNYVIITFGTDLQNVDFADKMYSKIHEWELEGFTRIFVKVRDTDFSEEVVEKECEKKKGVYVFGSENRLVYNADKIVNENTENMAKLRHLTYFAAYEPTLSAEELRAEAWKGWYNDFVQVQRDSNVYACLSLRMKLNLTGFDFVPVQSKLPSAAAKWSELYERNCPVRYSDAVINGKRSVIYDNAMCDKMSLRRIYAEQEHQRWNACMICNGIVPSSIEQIAHDNRGKRLDLRRHGNITTFDGLVRFREIVAENYGKTQESADVIRYDFQLMDDAVWLLESCGYKIVEKKYTDKE